MLAQSSKRSLGNFQLCLASCPSTIEDRGPDQGWIMVPASAPALPHIHHPYPGCLISHDPFPRLPGTAAGFLSLHPDAASGTRCPSKNLPKFPSFKRFSSESPRFAGHEEILGAVWRCHPRILPAQPHPGACCAPRAAHKLQHMNNKPRSMN